ncbi:MAG: hypothetical protein LBE14_02535 [Treponema sp.]|jgi:hypothetical protein|nr:hypothetical protein [Treponema sp.]
MYEPFRVEINQDPEILTALEDAEIPPVETSPWKPEGEPAEGVILERDGVHYINHRVLNPDEDTEKILNPQFLNLVESVMKPAAPGVP